MLFYVVGTLCLIGFLKMWAGPHRRRRGRCHRHGSRRWRRHLDGLFERLDTSPGQEKEIRSAVEDFFEDVVPMRRAMRHSLKDQILEVLAEEELDEDTLRPRMMEHETRVASIRESLLTLITRIHTALDSEQRAQLRRYVGRFSMPMSVGPYR